MWRILSYLIQSSERFILIQILSACVTMSNFLFFYLGTMIAFVIKFAKLRNGIHSRSQIYPWDSTSHFPPQEVRKGFGVTLLGVPMEHHRYPHACVPFLGWTWNFVYTKRTLLFIFFFSYQNIFLIWLI